jgi:glucan endo-1,3-alpha-glucosidase
MGVVLLLMALMGCATSHAAQAPSPAPKRVFAHYMVCYPTYSATVAGYEREIREAMNAGIDGFVLNVGAWSKEPYYATRCAAIYEAAKKVSADFKLFFSIDDQVLRTPEDFKDIVRTYAAHPNQFTHEGRPVVSTFGGSSGLRKTVLDPLRAEGINVFFVPFFYPQPNVTELPDWATVEAHIEKNAPHVDGLFYFGAAGLPETLAQCNAYYAQALRAKGKLFMASVAPFYWGARQGNRRYFEFRGAQGLAVQWEKIIEIQPEWVEIVTWNDFAESYLCPISDPGQYNAEMKFPPRPSHAAYLEFCKDYIRWYKTGQRPRIVRDELFYFYRPHPKDAVATQEEVNAAPEYLRGITTKPVTEFNGEVNDELFVTVRLTAPAQLTITTGTRVTTHALEAGQSHVQAPFDLGPQRFELRREGKLIISADGPAITGKPAWFNFFNHAGYAVTKSMRENP